MNAVFYLVISVVIGPLIGGGVVFYLQSRIRVREARETSRIQSDAQTAAQPLAVIMNQLVAKDAQIDRAQNQHHAFVETQMARNDATTQAILALAEQVRVQTGNLKDLSVSLTAHREESSLRGGKVYEKIGMVNERLATIEAMVKAA